MVTLRVADGTVTETLSPVLCVSCSSTCAGSALVATGREQLGGMSGFGAGSLLEQAARSRAATEQGSVRSSTISSHAVRMNVMPRRAAPLVECLAAAMRRGSPPADTRRTWASAELMHN